MKALDIVTVPVAAPGLLGLGHHIDGAGALIDHRRADNANLRTIDV